MSRGVGRLAPALVTALAVAAAADTARADAPLAPLTPVQRALFLGSAEDALDKPRCYRSKTRATARCRDRMSYVISNEYFHHAFHPYIARRGGAYVGVGADQGLTFVAWSRARLAWMIDYDPTVVTINRVHRALILHAPSARRFVALWTPKNERRAKRVLTRAYGRGRATRLMWRIYRRYRPRIHKHLRLMLALARPPRSWLARQADYAYVRRLFRLGRIRIMKGDLLRDRALRGIARVAKKLRVPVRTLYLSNAEQFWAYTPQFRRNIISLPMDVGSRLLRTVVDKAYGPSRGKFVYVIQDGRDLQRRLADRRIGNLRAVMARRKAGPRGVYTIALPTLALPTAPKRRKRKRRRTRRRRTPQRRL